MAYFHSGSTLRRCMPIDDLCGIDGRRTKSGQRERLFHIARGLISSAEVEEIKQTFMAVNANGPVPGLSEMVRYGSKTDYDANDPLHFYPRIMHPHRHPELPRRPAGDKIHARCANCIQSSAICSMMNQVAVQSMFYFQTPRARGQASCTRIISIYGVALSAPAWPRGSPSTMPIRTMAAWSSLPRQQPDGYCLSRTSRQHSLLHHRACACAPGIAGSAGQPQTGRRVVLQWQSPIHGSYPNAKQGSFPPFVHLSHYVPQFDRGCPVVPGAKRRSKARSCISMKRPAASLAAPRRRQSSLHINTARNAKICRSIIRSRVDASERASDDDGNIFLNTIYFPIHFPTGRSMNY